MQWLIDGHNLIGCMPNLHLDDPDDEEKLLEYLRRYRARTGHHLTVVFDSGSSYQPGQTRKKGGLTIQFVSPGQTADQILMRRMRQVKNSQAVGVVTSDQAVQQAARQAGLRVETSGEFARQLLAPPATETENNQRTNPRLSSTEVEEWLDIFNRRRP